MNKAWPKHDKTFLNTRKFLNIWFSNDPDIFLPPENILRMMVSIVKNKDANLSLVVKKSFLSEKGLSDMNKFCHDFNVNIVDLDEAIASEQNPDEIKLNNIISSELQNWIENKGGSPASAADMIRIKKSFLLEYGSYIDYDIAADFSNLNALHPVKFPLITHITINPLDLNSPEINNDIMAAAIDESGKITEEANILLNKMRTTVINKYEKFENLLSYSQEDVIGKVFGNDNHRYKEFLEHNFYILNNLVRDYLISGRETSIYDFRLFLLEKIDDKFIADAFGINLQPGEDPATIIGFCLAQQQKLSLSLPNDAEQMRQMGLDLILDSRQTLYMRTVQDISGPALINIIYPQTPPELFLETSNLKKYISSQSDSITINGKSIERKADISWFRDDQGVPLERKKYAENKLLLLEHESASYLKEKGFEYITAILENMPREFLPLFGIAVAESIISEKSQQNRSYIDRMIKKAINEERTEILKYLIENIGVDINDYDANGQTYLHIAANNNKLKAAKTLIDLKAEIDKATEAKANTPLHMATNKDLNIMAHLLVGAGADVNKPTKAGSTPLSIAIDKKLDNLVKIFSDSNKLSAENLLIADKYFSDKLSITPIIDDYKTEMALTGASIMKMIEVWPAAKYLITSYIPILPLMQKLGINSEFIANHEYEITTSLYFVGASTLSYAANANPYYAVASSVVYGLKPYLLQYEQELLAYVYGQEDINTSAKLAIYIGTETLFSMSLSMPIIDLPASSYKLFKATAIQGCFGGILKYLDHSNPIKSHSLFGDFVAFSTTSATLFTFGKFISESSNAFEKILFAGSAISSAAVVHQISQIAGKLVFSEPAHTEMDEIA